MQRGEINSSSQMSSSGFEPGMEKPVQINFTKNRNKVDEAQYKEYPKSIFLSPCPDGVKLDKPSGQDPPTILKSPLDDTVEVDRDSVSKKVSTDFILDA